MTSSSARYGAVAMALHWVIAVAIIGLTIGFVALVLKLVVTLAVIPFKIALVILKVAVGIPIKYICPAVI